MAKIRRKKETVSLSKNIELKKLCVCFVILNSGRGKDINNLFKKLEVAVTMTLKGEGTAAPGLYDLLGFVDNTKDVIIALVKEEKLNDLKRELDMYFLSHKKNKGVAAIIDLSSVVGGLAYRFLSNQY